MKTLLWSGLFVLLAASSLFAEGKAKPQKKPLKSSEIAEAFDAAVAAQPKLLRISGRIDGSGRITFTRGRVQYHHKHWSPPTKVLFDGEPWIKLDRTPAAWIAIGEGLDLSKARVVKRNGRDTIALEHTPDGFDLHLSDSPNGGADYEVTIAIPRR